MGISIFKNIPLEILPALSSLLKTTDRTPGRDASKNKMAALTFRPQAILNTKKKRTELVSTTSSSYFSVFMFPFVLFPDYLFFDSLFLLANLLWPVPALIFLVKHKVAFICS